MGGKYTHCHAKACPPIARNANSCGLGNGGNVMKQHLAIFLEAADTASADIYLVREELASELERLSGQLLKDPGLGSDPVENQEVCRRLSVLAQALYHPDRSEQATSGAASLRQASMNADVLARRIQFGVALRALRVRQGMRQKELALKAKIDPGYESRLERFLAGPPSQDVVQRLSAALGDVAGELPAAHQATPAWHPSSAPRLKASAEYDDLLGQLLAVCAKLPLDHLRIILAQAQAVYALVASQKPDRHVD